MKRWRPSIQLQIFAAITTVAAVIIAGFSALVVVRVQSRADALAFEAAREDARLVALIASRGLDKSAVSFRVAVRGLRKSGALFRFGEGDTNTRVQFYDVEGHRVFDSEQTDEHRSDAPATEDVVRALARAPLDTPTLAPDGYVAAAVPIEKDERAVGAVRVLKPSLGMQGILAHLAPEVTLLAGGFVFLALLMALAIGRSLSRPIRTLTDATRQIAAGNRAVALPSPRGREVADLTGAFEDMRRELEDMNRIERLTQDLSHELKNPVAAIRSLTETLDAGAIRDPEAGPRLVRRSDEAIRRLDAIVTDLMALARLEAKGIDRDRKIDMARLAREAVAEVQSGRDAKIAVDIAELPLMRGDPAWLRRALINLLTNALDAGGRASLRLLAVDGQLVVTVANPGEVPESVRANMFERFVTRRPEGTGLGLAIVRGVSEAHGGSARLENPGPPDVRINMLLPI